MTYNEPRKSDKIVPIICGVIFLAFLACLPAMWHDKQQREAQAWHDYGCQMYDDYKIDKVPAKCQSEFVDHYQAQQTRLQPPATPPKDLEGSDE